MGAGGDPRRAVGASGEEAVARWYEARGFEVLDRNWRVREGELDIVARTSTTLVFCEVKTRRGMSFGAPIEAVTVRKQQRLRTLARLWLMAHDGRAAAELRFDIASVMPDGRNGWTIDVLEGAF